MRVGTVLALITGLILTGGPALAMPGQHSAQAHRVLSAESAGGQALRAVAMPPTGVITTYAGGGSNSSGSIGDGGPATQAVLTGPLGLTMDAHGTLLVADTQHSRVRVVPESTGVITTFAYTPGPEGIAVDSAGNVFVTGNDYRIYEVVSGTHVISPVAGTGTDGYSGDGGPALQAGLAYVPAIAVDRAGNLFLAEGDDRIREVFAASGVITTIVGTGSPGCTGTEPACFGGDGGPARQAALNRPYGLAVDSTGNIFIADVGNNRVREVLASTGVITTIAGTGSATTGGDGGPASQADLGNPYTLALDGMGDLFIGGPSRVREVVASTHSITTVAGTGVAGYSGDGGPATGARLDWVAGLAVDSTGNLFIADANNNRVRVVGGIAASPPATPNSTSTPVGSSTNTATPRPTRTATGTPTQTATPKPTKTATSTPTETWTPRPTRTPTSIPTVTRTATPKPTKTATCTPTNTATPRPTRTATGTPTQTATPKPTKTPTSTPTETWTPRPTRTPTSIRTATQTATATMTLTPRTTNTPLPPTSTSTASMPSSPALAGPSVTASLMPSSGPGNSATSTIN